MGGAPSTLGRRLRSRKSSTSSFHAAPNSSMIRPVAPVRQQAAVLRRPLVHLERTRPSCDNHTGDGVPAVGRNRPKSKGQAVERERWLFAEENRRCRPAEWRSRHARNQTNAVGRAGRFCDRRPSVVYLEHLGLHFRALQRPFEGAGWSSRGGEGGRAASVAFYGRKSPLPTRGVEARPRTGTKEMWLGEWGDFAAAFQVLYICSTWGCILGLLNLFIYFAIFLL